MSHNVRRDKKMALVDLLKQNGNTQQFRDLIHNYIRMFILFICPFLSRKINSCSLVICLNVLGIDRPCQMRNGMLSPKYFATSLVQNTILFGLTNM